MAAAVDTCGKHNAAEMAAFGRRLKRTLDTPDAYKHFLIKGRGLRGKRDLGTWFSGGCWLLAEALFRVLQNSNTFVVYEDHGVRGTRGQGPIHHVVCGVLVDEPGSRQWRYVDADGMSTAEALCRSWHEREGLSSPKIRSLWRTEMESSGIPEPTKRSVAALSEYVLAHCEVPR